MKRPFFETSEHIFKGENEANVRFLLNRFPDLRLVKQEPHVGGRGLIGDNWLSPSEAECVQRFDPRDELDTIGFFIAKFVKSVNLH